MDFRPGFQFSISMSGFDFRLILQAAISSLDFRLGFQDFRLGFQAWISGLDFRFGCLEVWISGFQDFRLGFPTAGFQAWTPGLDFKISGSRLAFHHFRLGFQELGFRLALKSAKVQPLKCGSQAQR